MLSATRMVNPQFDWPAGTVTAGNHSVTTTPAGTPSMLIVTGPSTAPERLSAMPYPLAPPWSSVKEYGPPMEIPDVSWTGMPDGIELGAVVGGASEPQLARVASTTRGHAIL